jgi:hypothetical protein
LNDYWWKLITETSSRDQLSFNYAVWKTKTKLNVLPKKCIKYFKHAGGDRRI